MNKKNINQYPPVNDILRIKIFSGKNDDSLAYKDGVEVAQRIVISRNGRCYLTRMTWIPLILDKPGYDEKSTGLKSKTEITFIGKEKAAEIFKKTFEDFIDYDGESCSDASVWTLEIDYENGKKIKRNCSFGAEPEGYSDYIREILGNKDLMVCGRISL